jgi:periplasmic divalent cation tolerance protein
MTAVRVVFVTVPDNEVAKKIARTLVEERLAACVNILPPITSVYRWEGKIEEGPEILLMIKTVNERLATLFSRIKELHPYKVPEAIALPVDAGLPAYVQWVVAETEHLIV